MAKKNIQTNEKDKNYSLPKENKAEVMLKTSFEWIAKNRRNILIAIIAIVVLSGGYLAYKIISQNKKYQIVTSFFKANKEYAQKLREGRFDLNSIGNTMKKLRKITEMSKSVEESLLARYFLGILHYNIGLNQNKRDQFFKARDYWQIVAEHSDFEFAPQCLLALGSAYEELNKANHYRRAIDFYNVVIKRYPSTIHSFRAMYKKGICYLKMNKKDLAVSTFKRIPKHLPGDKAARRENLYYSMAQYYIITYDKK